ncbi:MAG: metallophosphoesterase [Myxococcota bacterium]
MTNAPPSTLRRRFFSRLVFHLAALLGAGQAALAHWVHAVAWSRPPLSGWVWVGTAVGLGLANAWIVPWLNQARRRQDRAGRLARFYMEFGVASMFVALAVAGSWLVYGTASLVAAPFGVSSEAIWPAFRWLSTAGVFAVAGYLLYGFTWGQRRVDVSETRFTLRELHPQLAGLRLAQISDLHIGNGLEGRRLERMVERVNATEADLVVMTGDIFDFDPRFVEDGARRLGGLRARYGVYAILGNHDRYVGSELVANALATHAPEIRLLRDEWVRVPTERPFYLGGIEDRGEYWFGTELRYDAVANLAASRPDDGAHVLLVHQPELFSQAADHGFPLVLAGHTHGGQIALPVAGGRVNLARVMSPLTRGRYEVADSTLYVNRGLGVGGPAVRIHCDREIAVHRLEPA